MMRNCFVAVLAFLFSVIDVMGQKIAITPMVPDELNLQKSVSNTLKQRLLQMTAANGMGSSSGEFLLTANIVPIEKEIIPTAPSMVKVNLEISVYAVAVTEQVIIGEMSFEVKAVEKNESLAMSSAIRKINPRTDEVKAFMSSVREKIAAYYKERTPAIIAKAKQLASREEYDLALETLSSVPESVDQYPEVCSMMTAVYQQMIDKDALRALQEANSKIAVKKYNEAMDCLLYVDPFSKHASEARKLINQVRQSVQTSDRMAYESKIKEKEEQMEMIQRAHDDEMLLKKMQIQASYKAAESNFDFGALKDKVSDWLFGKLI